MLYAWRNGRIGIVSTFTLMLQDTTQSEQVDNVTSFVGEDDSGAFGILARHTRMMTILVAGLARFRGDDENWNYIATPGAVLYFCNNILTLSTRHYLCDRDYMRISSALREQLLTQEEQLRATKDSLRQMEEALMKRMWEMGRSEV